jgi:hypothetical protein
MSNSKSRNVFPFIAAGVIVDEGEAHLCVLGDDGWPHYTSVELDDPARWRKALATLADPETPTLGKHRRPALRKPVWLGMEEGALSVVSRRLLALVLLPKGQLSIVPRADLMGYADRVGATVGCRFDRSELLANYVMRVRPEAHENVLEEAADTIHLAAARSRAGR